MLKGLGQEPEAAEDTAIRLRRARMFKLLGTIASATLFALSLAVLYFVIGELDRAQVKAAFARASGEQITLAIFFTAISYLMSPAMTGWR